MRAGRSFPGRLAASAVAAIPWIPSIAGAAFFLAVIRRPDLMGIPLVGEGGRTITVWPHPAHSLALYAIALLASALAALRALRTLPGRLFPRAAWPLAALPAAFLPLPLGPLTGPTLPGLLLFVIPLILLSLFCLFALEGLARTGGGRMTDGQTAGLLFAAFTVLFTLTGVAFTRLVGPVGGDEVHYLIQAESIWRDGDLDLRNTLPPNLGKADWYSQHIGATSRGGAWYSWHPYGLSLLLAPTVPLGTIPRHLVLALLSGAGLAGVYLLARLGGAGRHVAAYATVLLGISLLWGVYSSRALPEVAGGALTVWLVLASFSQDRWPRGSVALAAIAATALPFLHPRFAPASLIGAMAFVLLALAPDPRDRRAWFRCGLLVAVGAVGAAGYLGVQYSHFEGGNAYGHVTSRFFSAPEGILTILASSRGVLASFPAFLWLVAAVVLSAIRGAGRPRLLSIVAILNLVATLLVSCTNRVIPGGAALEGRFLVPVAPLLMAAGAAALGRCGRAGRWWFALLASWSVLLFALLVGDLSSYGGLFGYAFAPEVVNPVFHRLIRPLPDPGGILPLAAVLAAYGVTLLLLTPRFRAGRGQFLLAGGLVAAVCLCAAAPRQGGGEAVPGQRSAVQRLAGLDLGGAAVRVRGGGGGDAVRGALRGPLAPASVVDPFEEAWVRASLLRAAGEPAASAAVFGEAAALSPARTAPLVGLASCYRALGRAGDAAAVERRILAACPGDRADGTVFGGAIRLRAWEWTVRGRGPAGGAEVRLDLCWEAVEPPGRDCTVFVHFVHDGRILFQGDHPLPLAASSWKPGEVVGDSSCLEVPPGVDPAGVSIVVGLVDTGGGRRLRTDRGSDKVTLRPG